MILKGNHQEKFSSLFFKSKSVDKVYKNSNA